MITAGLDAIEYDPRLWKTGNHRPVVAIDVESIQQDQAFLPAAEGIGVLASPLDALAPQLNVSLDKAFRSSSEALS